MADDSSEVPSRPAAEPHAGKAAALPLNGSAVNPTAPAPVNGLRQRGEANGRQRSAAVLIEPAAPGAATAPAAATAPPATCGRLLWQRLGQSATGEATLEFIKVHDLADGSRWIEARSLSLTALPSAVAVDFAVTPLASVLDTFGLLLSQRRQVALLFRGDGALKLLRLRPGEPCLFIEEAGVVGKVEAMTGQWIRAADLGAYRRPPLVNFDPIRRSLAARPASGDESGLGDRSFSANVVRFGHFLLLVVLAVFRR